MDLTLRGRALRNSILRYFDSPEYKLLEKLRYLVSKCKSQCSVYTDLGPSPYDNNLGYTSYDLKKYKRLLSTQVSKFKKNYRNEIDKLGLKDRVEKIIDEAKSFDGETVYKKDPNARPGRNHHTGRPYY